MGKGGGQPNKIYIYQGGFFGFCLAVPMMIGKSVTSSSTGISLAAAAAAAAAAIIRPPPNVLDAMRKRSLPLSLSSFDLLPFFCCWWPFCFPPPSSAGPQIGFLIRDGPHRRVTCAPLTSLPPITAHHHVLIAAYHRSRSASRIPSQKI